MATSACWSVSSPSRHSSTPMTGVRLEERFWLAFDSKIDNGPPPIERREFLYTGAGGPTPVSASRTNFPIPVDHRHLESSRLSDQAVSAPNKNRVSSRECVNTYAELQSQRRKNSGSLKLKVPPPAPSITSAIAKSTRTPHPASAHRTYWRLQTPGVKKPTTPALELVSKFLDKIGRVAEPRSANPTPSIRVNENGEVLIMESDVIIDLVEETPQIGLCSPLIEKPMESDLEKLRIPLPPGQAAADRRTSGPHCSFVANGTAGSCVRVRCDAGGEVE